MDWFSYKCTIFDTPVTVHYTFLLQLVLSILHSIKNFHLLLSIFSFLLYGPILLITILTHEFGHILATKALGGTIGGIVLWPLGGLALCGSTGRGPCGELKVSIAGPLTHIPQGCIWYGVYYLATKVVSHQDEFDFHWFIQQLFKIGLDYQLLRGHFLLLVFAKAAQLNLMLLVLNLLPMYPLDGGWVIVSSLLLCGLRDQNKIGSLVAKAGMGLSLTCGVLLGIVIFQSGLNVVVFGWCFYQNWKLYKLADNERADEHPLFSTQEGGHEQINSSETVYNVDHAQTEYGQMPTWSNANNNTTGSDSSGAQAPWWKLWRGRQGTAVGNQDSQAFLSTNQNGNAAVEEDYGF